MEEGRGVVLLGDVAAEQQCVGTVAPRETRTAYKCIVTKVSTANRSEQQAESALLLLFLLFFFSVSLLRVQTGMHREARG